MNYPHGQPEGKTVYQTTESFSEKRRLNTLLVLYCVRH